MPSKYYGLWIFAVIRSLQNILIVILALNAGSTIVAAESNIPWERYDESADLASLAWKPKHALPTTSFESAR